MTENTQEKSSPLSNLVRRVTSDFNDRVKSETNASNVLLKGHLLIENILEECLAVFDMKGKGPINRMGFYQKTKLLSEISSNIPELNNTLLGVVPMLYSLNDVRNNLAHDLSFAISEADINKVGIHLGSKYIIKKYEVGHKEIRENLLFLLDHMVDMLGLIIFIKMKEIKKSSLTLPLESKSA